MCGDGLGPAVAAGLETLDASDVLTGHSPIDSVMVFGPRGASFRSVLPEVDGREARGYVISRQEFDDKLLHAAVAAGAETALGRRFVSTTLLVDARQIVIARGEERRYLTAEVLIGAGGANSRVRKAFGVAPKPASSRTSSTPSRASTLMSKLCNKSAPNCCLMPDTYHL